MKFHFSKAERQHFTFFLVLDVYFNQRVNEEHICKGAPGQDQLLLWLRSEETLQTTEKLSPFLRKIGRRFCT